MSESKDPLSVQSRSLSSSNCLYMTDILSKSTSPNYSSCLTVIRHVYAYAVDRVLCTQKEITSQTDLYLVDLSSKKHTFLKTNRLSISQFD